MKLQIALDTVSMQQAVNIIKKVHKYIDIVEVGTPMIIDFGMEAVKIIKKTFPDILVLADTKIMDAGEYEAKMVFEAKADIVTVMGITHVETILGVVKAASEVNKMVLADMMCVKNLEERAKRLVEIGVDYICVHTAVDVQATENPYDELARIQKTVGSKRCAIAGGITIDSINKVVDYKPEIVIVGGGITGQKNKKEVAATFRQKLDIYV
ncbi:3-hexulose-6-phosphate synthase [Halocella sp. SP3-1]|uniref:3-hexulose-6-phosphate synthase n=1 Tax=Halocella sp. SP3-1 TaxID=2382161 RepID=UPI000F757676|nr:3-hexulose-6-phosphate synthase [Halocella sp. SP3-1]AZO94143.1 3-hexulose-6-phosphate synthase [Halocella sp. SP3-1]